jgi:hypothetical protein
MVVLLCIVLSCLFYNNILKRVMHSNGIFKNILLAVIWCLAGLLYIKPFQLPAITWFIFLQIAGWSLQFDIFNKDRDKLIGQKSFVHIAGLYNTNVISIAGLFISYSILIAHANGLVATSIILLQIFCFMQSKRITTYIWFYGLIDTMLMCCAIMLSFS